MTTSASMPSPHPEPAEAGPWPEDSRPAAAPDLASEIGTRTPIEPGPDRLSHRVDFAAVLTVVRITVARQNRGRRLLILALLFSLPIVFAILTRRYQTPYRPEPVETVLVFGLIFA